MGATAVTSAKRDMMLIAAAMLLAIGIPIFLLWPVRVTIAEPPPLTVPPMPNPSFTLTGAASARPLFRANRTPPPEEDDQTPVSAEAPPADPPRLVGIVARPGLGVALIVNAAGETVTAHVGDAIDGWQVTAVARDRVRLAKDGAVSEAALDFTNKQRSAASAVQSPNPGPMTPIPLPPSSSPASSVGPSK